MSLDLERESLAQRLRTENGLINPPLDHSLNHSPDHHPNSSPSQSDPQLENQAANKSPRANCLDPREVSEIVQRNAHVREVYVRALSRVSTLEEKKSGLEELAKNGFIPELLDLVEVDKLSYHGKYKLLFREVVNHYMELSAKALFQDPETLNHVILMVTKTDEKSIAWLRNHAGSNSREKDSREKWDVLNAAFEFFADTISNHPDYNHVDSHEINSFLGVFLPTIRMIDALRIQMNKYECSFKILTGNGSEMRRISYNIGNGLRGIKAVGKTSSGLDPKFRFFKGKGPIGNHDTRLVELDPSLGELNLEDYLRDCNGKENLEGELSKRGISPYILSGYQGFELQLREGRIVGAQIGSKIDGIHNLFYEKGDSAMVPRYETVEKLVSGFMRSINPALFAESFQGVSLRMNPKTGHYPIARDGIERSSILSTGNLSSRVQIASMNALSEMRASPAYAMPQYTTQRTNAA